MIKYIKCPRCELNYINADEQEYCDVCLAELQGKSLKFADLDDDEEMEKTELCPVCGINYMRYGEKMCEDCKLAGAYEEDDIDPEKDDEWRNYLDDDDDDLLLDEEPIGSIADEIASEFADDFDEEEDEYTDSHDDFEEVDYHDVDFDDEDDDDDDFDDDDDDDDDDF